jgi:putative membrane protein
VHWASGWGPGDWLVMMLVMVAMWGLLIAGVYSLLRAFGRPRDERPATADRPPERILEERFARGEIDEEEFKHRREALSSRT